MSSAKKSNRRHWLILVACCGLTASAIGVFTNSLGVFYTAVSESLGVGRGAIAMHVTLSTLATAALTPVAAKLLYKAPLRLYLGFGIAVSCTTTALMSFADSLWQFYVLGTLRGVGIAFFSILPVTAVISNWFHKRNGLAVGISLSFSGLSGAIFSPLFTWIIEAWSWQSAYLCMAGFGFLLALPAVFLLRLTPEEIGLAPYGGSPVDRSAPAAQVGSQEKAKLYLPALALVCLFSILLTSVTALGQHFPSLAVAAGMTAQVGAMMVSAGMVGNIVSKLIIGVLSDHKGPFFACTCMIVTNALALGVLLNLPGGMPAIALGTAFFYGAVYSVGAAGISLLTRGMFGAEQYTSAYSIVSLFSNSGSAFALTLVGLVYDLTGGYTVALIGGIAIQAANLALLFCMARMRKRRVGY